MKIQENVDIKLDPFFKRHGKTWVLAINIVGAIGLPIATLWTVLYGTKQLPGGGYQLEQFFLIPMYIVILLSFFNRYLVRYERETYKQTIGSMVIALVLSTIAVALSLPGMPLASHWHAPTPWTNLMVLAPTAIALLAGIVVVYVRAHRVNARQIFTK